MEEVLFIFFIFFVFAPCNSAKGLYNAKQLEVLTFLYETDNEKQN